MEVQLAVAKVNKYATSESGDTLEIVERPNGGLSVVLADGQTSGRGAKAISQMVVRRVIGLLAEGSPRWSRRPRSIRRFVYGATRQGDLHAQHRLGRSAQPDHRTDA